MQFFYPPRREVIMAIKKLWIEDGCTVCHLCESTAPDVFEVPDTGAQVKVDAGQHFAKLENDIADAAAGCPVEIIHFEDETGKITPPSQGEAPATAVVATE